MDFSYEYVLMINSGQPTRGSHLSWGLGRELKIHKCGNYRVTECYTGTVCLIIT